MFKYYFKNQKKFLFFLTKKINWKILFFFLIILLCFYRSPYIFLNGRFVAEEGSFFFFNAFKNGMFEGLTQVYWGSSYLNFWANFSSVIATLFPLKYSPLVTVYLSFFVKLILIFFILFQKNSFLSTNTSKYLASLIVIVNPTMVAELWLNTLVSQVYFTILAILIFFENENRKFFFISSLIILLIGSLSSLMVCVLVIGFFYKYLKSNNFKNLSYFITLAAGTTLQLLIFFYSYINNLALGGVNERFLISLNKIFSYFYNVIVKSVFGRDFSQFFYNNILNENKFLLFFILIFFIYLLTFLLKKEIHLYKKDNASIFILFFFILESFLAIIASKDNLVYGRFSSIPGVLFIFLILRLCILSKKNSIFFFSLIFISIFSGFYEFKHNNKFYPEFFECFNCPNWVEEVNKWEKDKNYILKIWQYPNKLMKLF